MARCFTSFSMTSTQITCDRALLYFFLDDNPAFSRNINSKYHLYLIFIPVICSPVQIYGGIIHNYIKDFLEFVVLFFRNCANPVRKLEWGFKPHPHYDIFTPSKRQGFLSNGVKQLFFISKILGFAYNFRFICCCQDKKFMLRGAIDSLI